MSKLNQIIAIEKGVKARVYSHLTEINKLVQKADLFHGFDRTYQSKEEGGEEIPPEQKRVQADVGSLLKRVAATMADVFKVTARKDWTNSVATADVVVNGKAILAAVPVTYLLFLEKQVQDLLTLFGNLPTLDEAELWSAEPSTGFYRSALIKTHRTKKIPKTIVMLQPTVEHPGQAQLISEDVISGYWTASKQSGAMPKPDRQAILERTESLLRAVKEAREAANGVEEVTSPDTGKAIFNYLLEK